MNTIFEAVKNHISTVDAAMKYGFDPVKKGNRWWCVCPWHQDSHPSLCLFSDGGFKCFVCGESGQDAIRLAEKRFNIKPLEAVKMLCYDFGLSLDIKSSTDSYEAYKDEDRALTLEAEKAAARIMQTFNILCGTYQKYKKLMQEAISQGVPKDSYDFQKIIFAYDFFDRYSDIFARADTQKQIEIILSLKENYEMEKGAFERWAGQVLKAN